jgi:homoprotocatechuate degradation regulator HpaR
MKTASPPKPASSGLPPYRSSLAGTLLAAREAVMAPVRPILREIGVTEQQWRVMRVLTDQDECEPSRLARQALLHPPSVTRILKELADRGLVVREADPNDGRRAVLRISPQGRALVLATAKRTAAVFQSYAAVFGRERLTALQQELTALTADIASFADRAEEDA